jgi:hypothetical protein
VFFVVNLLLDKPPLFSYRYGAIKILNTFGARPCPRFNQF